MIVLSVLLLNLFPSSVHAGVTDNRGRTPLDLAVKYNRTDIVDYLRRLPQPSTPKLGVHACV